MVDPNQALRFRESADGVKAVGGDPQAAAKLGDMLNAEVIVVGSAVAQENDVSSIKGLAGTGVKSASAVVSLKAFNVSTREILAAKSANGAMVNVSPIVAGNKAIEKAIHALLASQGGFFESIVENWRRSAADGQNFVVEVSGVDEFSQIRVLRDIIATKATKVEQRSYQKPLLIFEVTRPGTAEDLAGVLDALQIEGQKLSVEGLNGNIINISVTKASE
ncbi:MAG: hypothetical protein GX801_07270 [Fibrobacter sp.]|nr:hypothetical protein [Fibrobacter sp.]